MKVKAFGYQITEVPGFVEVRVVETEHTSDGVHVVLDDGDVPRTFNLTELGELVAALTEAHMLGVRFAEQLRAK